MGTSLGRRAGFDVFGKNGRTLIEAWRDGPRTVHGLQSDGFPNLFFLGVVQGGFTLNYMHMADEQARHIAHVITEVGRRGAQVVEATPEGVEAWVAEIRDKRPSPARTHLCTPSYANSEGDAENPHGIEAIRYGAGSAAFFALLARWRETGELAGSSYRDPSRSTDSDAQSSARRGTTQLRISHTGDALRVRDGRGSSARDNGTILEPPSTAARTAD